MTFQPWYGSAAPQGSAPPPGTGHGTPPWPAAPPPPPSPPGEPPGKPPVVRRPWLWVIVAVAVAVVTVVTVAAFWVARSDGNPQLADSIAPAASSSTPPSPSSPSPPSPSSPTGTGPSNVPAPAPPTVAASSLPTGSPPAGASVSVQTAAASGNGSVQFMTPLTSRDARIVTIHGQSSGAFVVAVVDGQGATAGLLVDRSGAYDGIRLLAPAADVSGLRITSAGPWSVRIANVTAAHQWDGATPLTGESDEVLMVSGGLRAPVTLGLTNAGGSPFLVQAIGATRTVLVNAAGDYRGATTLPSGTTLLEIQSDGRWSITPQ